MLLPVFVIVTSLVSASTMALMLTAPPIVGLGPALVTVTFFALVTLSVLTTATPVPVFLMVTSPVALISVLLLIVGALPALLTVTFFAPAPAMPVLPLPMTSLPLTAAPPLFATVRSPPDARVTAPEYAKSSG